MQPKMKTVYILNLKHNYCVDSAEIIDSEITIYLRSSINSFKRHTITIYEDQAACN